MILPPPPKELDPATAATLRAALIAGGMEGGIFRLLGMVGPPGWKASMRAASFRLPGAGGVLTRFFIVGDELREPELAPAIGGPDVLAALERAEIAQRGSVGWRCRLILIPAGGVLAFSDPIEDPASTTPPDEFILPIGVATRFVDDLSVREPCELAIDLGCGQGYLALRSLTHAQRCIASDINPRAVAFARLNAGLNGGADRVDTRLGSFFEPLADVAGRIDLITCNPPFIILPGEHVTALSTSMEGDGMLEHLVRTSPAMLREGGWATYIGLWEHPDLADWVSRIRGWSEGSGCDVLTLQFRTYRPDEYFQQWFDPAQRAGAEPGWRAVCERRRIGAITYGGIILRKRAGTNWLRAMFTLINVRAGEASDQLRAFFASQTALEALPSAAAILDHRLRVAGGWRFDPMQLPRGAPAGASRGLALPLPRAAETEPFLAAFQGQAPARQVLDQLNQASRPGGGPADEATMAVRLQTLVAGGALDIVD
jgi:SAM-dependent methyltransferase